MNSECCFIFSLLEHRVVHFELETSSFSTNSVRSLPRCKGKSSEHAAKGGSDFDLNPNFVQIFETLLPANATHMAYTYNIN